MSYKNKEWKDGDIITAEALNNLEEGVHELHKPNGVTAGTYGGYKEINADRGVYNIPVVKVDENGRVVEVVNKEISLADPERYLEPGLVTGQMLTIIKTKAKAGNVIVGGDYQFVSFDDLFADDIKEAISNKVYCPRILNVLVKVIIDSKGTTVWASPDWYGVSIAPTYTHIYLTLPSMFSAYNPAGSTFDVQIIFETGLRENDGSISFM